MTPVHMATFNPEPRGPEPVRDFCACHAGCVCSMPPLPEAPQPPQPTTTTATNLIRRCFLEQTAAWVEIYVNILKGTLAQGFICAGSDVKLAPSDYFQFICKSKPKENSKGYVIFIYIYPPFAFFCYRALFLRLDIVVSAANIAKGGADVPDPARLPRGPAALLEQMCSAIVNRHVCLSPSYYSRRVINRLITQKHQCKATEQ